MKKFIIISFLMLVSYNLTAQIAFTKFEYGTEYLTPELESFKFQLREEFGKYYYLLQEDLDPLLDEKAKSSIREIFKEKLKLQFLPASYILSCKISIPFQGCKLYNINISLTETETRIEKTITAIQIPENSLKNAADYIVQIYKNTIPAFHAITGVVGYQNLIIDYGKDRNAEENQKFELYKFVDENQIPIGSIKIIAVNNKASICEIIKINNEDKIDDENYKKYFVQTIIVREKEKEFREELDELKKEPTFVEEDDEDDYVQIKLKYIEHANISINNFVYSDVYLTKFFNKETFNPFIFGLKWILLPGDRFAFYIGGKVSNYTSITEVDNEFGQIKSKFMFYQGGAGFNINLPVSDIFIPGIGVGVNFHEFKLVKEDLQNKQLYAENINGLDYEFRAFASLRLLGYFGLHGEISYHLNPSLIGSESSNITTNAISIGVGISIFVGK